MAEKEAKENEGHETVPQEPEAIGTYMRLRLNLKTPPPDSNQGNNNQIDVNHAVKTQIPEDDNQITRKPILLLDLDGTLVMTTNNRELVNSLRTPDFTFWLIDELTFGYRRPHVEEFLKWCNQHFQVYLWTAAHGTYAQLVMECLAQLLHDYEMAQNHSLFFGDENGNGQQEPVSSEIWDTPVSSTVEDSFLLPRIEHLGDKVVSRQTSSGKIGSRLPSTDTDLSRKVSVVHEREESLHIESYADGELTKTEEVMKNDGEISESGLVHPLTHNNEGENLTFYEAEAEIHSRDASRVVSREASLSGPANGSPIHQDFAAADISISEIDPATHGFLDEPEHARLPIPVIRIFDKNECLIDWKGAGAWVTKDLHDLASKYFPGIDIHDFVVIDNDPHTYNRNKEQAMPIETYWGSTYDSELLHITGYLRDVYLPCQERSLLDLQAWGASRQNNAEEPL